MSIGAGLLSLHSNSQSNSHSASECFYGYSSVLITKIYTRLFEFAH